MYLPAMGGETPHHGHHLGADHVVVGVTLPRIDSEGVLPAQLVGVQHPGSRGGQRDVASLPGVERCERESPSCAGTARASGETAHRCLRATRCPGSRGGNHRGPGSSAGRRASLPWTRARSRDRITAPRLPQAAPALPRRDKSMSKARDGPSFTCPVGQAGPWRQNDGVSRRSTNTAPPAKRPRLIGPRLVGPLWALVSRSALPALKPSRPGSSGP